MTLNRRLLATQFAATTLACTLLAGTVLAEDDFRGPETMNEDDRNAFIQAELDYGQCLREKSMENIDKVDDIRRVADMAMQECNSTVEAMQADIAQRGFSPRFAQMYSSRMVKRVTKRFLPGLMQLKAGG